MSKITKYSNKQFEEKMMRLTSELVEQFKESASLDKEIKRNLQELGYGE